MKKTTIIAIAGVGLGALAGYLYYHFVGCNSGTCLITSKPVNSTLYGAVMGFLLSRSISTEKVNGSEERG